MKKIQILGLFVLYCIVFPTTMQAQDITNKLGGTASTDEFKVTDSNDNVLFEVQGDGKVGIGTTNPQKLLHMSGSGIVTARVTGANSGGNPGPIFQLEDTGTSGVTWNLESGRVAGAFSVYQSGTGTRLLIDNSGNIGIGTTSPSGKLHIKDGHFLLQNGSMGFNYSGSLTDATGSWAHISTNSSGDLGFATNQNLIFLTSNNNERMRITTAGNVGIGTTSPGQKLTVAGTVESTTGGFKFPDGTTQTTAAAGGVSGSGSSGQVSFWTGSSSLSGDNSLFWDNTNNRLGIGTTSPGTKLEVNGKISISGSENNIGSGDNFLLINDTQSDVVLQGARGASGDIVFRGRRHIDFQDYDASNATRVRIETGTGNVGIGTTSPGNLLHLSVDDATASGVTDLLRIEHTTTGTPAAGIGAGIAFHVEDAGGSEEQGSIDVILDDVTNAAEDATMTFNINQNGTISEIMRIDGTSGNVGIGTTSPGALLDVRGDAVFNEDGAYKDFRIEGATDANLFFIDASADKIGIGTTSPGQKLDVAGTAQMTGFKMPTGASYGYVLTSDASGVGAWQAAAGGIGGSGTANYVPKFTASTTIGNSSISESGGNVGIAMSASSSHRLKVNGHGYFAGYLDIGTMSGTTSGSYVRWYGGRLYYYSSSARYKEYIQPLEDDFCKILQADPKSFIDKTSGEREIGFIAEEFDALGLDNLVTYKDGQPDAIKYELVSLYLLEVVKDHQKIIEQQRSELDQTKAQLNEIKSKMSRIESALYKLDELTVVEGIFNENGIKNEMVMADDNLDQ